MAPWATSRPRSCWLQWATQCRCRRANGYICMTLDSASPPCLCDVRTSGCLGVGAEKAKNPPSARAFA
jgi:hypothetical protein